MAVCMGIAGTALAVANRRKNREGAAAAHQSPVQAALEDAVGQACESVATRQVARDPASGVSLE
jgi:hypothetical protein